MICAYDKIYLNSAQNILGTMLDAAVNELGLELNDFYAGFLNSMCSIRFAKGDPQVIAGRSGLELLRDVLTDGGNDAAERVSSIVLPYTKSPEYWTGWALAYYQWHRGVSFDLINREVPIGFVLECYHPYHEMDILQFVDAAEERRRQNRLEAYLKYYRRQAGLTQEELAEAVGIPVKTIRQYEQRQKNINHAQTETVLKIARVLCCDPAQLLEQ